jgi:predicted metal-dependent hydrolase
MPLSKIRLKVKYTSRNDSLDIRALDAKTLFVKAPQGCSTKDIQDVLKREQDKILAMLADASERFTSIDYRSGGKVLFMGAELTLQFLELEGYVWRFRKPENVLCIDRSHFNNAEIVVKDFYECQAEELRFRCKALAQRHGFAPKRISTRWTTSRWGSCSGNGNISLSRGLILAPREIQDYIILHELCHLKQPDHSMAFYAILEKLDPDYREHQAWLKVNGWKLRCFPQTTM